MSSNMFWWGYIIGLMVANAIWIFNYLVVMH